MSQRYLGGVITANPTTPTMTSESGVWTLEQQFQYSNVWSPEIVGNSLRARSSASAYLSRTPASASNRQIWTWSGWVKIGDVSNGSTLVLFSSGDGTTSNYSRIEIVTNQIQFINVIGAASAGSAQTTAVFRDPSAWYHIVVAVDTTQATAANRAVLYVNGVSVPFTFSTNVTQNSNTWINSTNAHYLAGRQSYAASGYFDGYMAEIYFVDGQALTPSSFGAFDSNGVWQPLPYTGAFGTNGFYVDFSDNSGTTSTTLGKDYSGNGNNWTPNNFSLTAGATYDWMLDSPTNYADGGNGRGNYAVLNPLDFYVAGATPTNSTAPTNGNLKVTANASSWSGYRSTIQVSSGKWYVEGNCTAGTGTGANATLGIVNTVTGTYVEVLNAAGSSTDVLGLAADLDGGSYTLYRNNTSVGTGSLSADVLHAFYCRIGNGPNVDVNFGQRPFAYTPPTGFKALNTQNLPVANITNGAKYMAATTYTGTGSSLTVSNGNNNTIGTSFKPDLVWMKSRSNATNNDLTDSVRGVTKVLYSEQTAAESTWSDNLTSFDAGGFTIAANSTFNTINVSPRTYVAWQWQAGQGVTSSNTNGSITSTTSVNAAAGFSIVTYTGTGANATVGHGLGVAPSFIIAKARGSQVTTSDWACYHVSLGATNRIWLNLTNATAASVTYWNNTAPTSSVFSLGTEGTVNTNGNTNVAYCFAAVAGFSEFGSYTGNGSNDGPFVYCGFRPRYILLKNTSVGTAGYDWEIIDTSRSSYNVANAELAANLSNAESSSWNAVDVLSNGFKIRDLGAAQNGSGNTIIFAAFAENPFNISRAR